MAGKKQIRAMGRAFLATGFALLLFLPVVAWAHCDSLDGPVVADARKALASGDVSPVLKWVRSQDEAEIRAAFQQVRVVRALSTQARELADRYFFETLVRVHRMGEGAPYTGLKPAGSEIDPGIRAADTAIETGLVDPLTRRMNEAVAAGIHKRFALLLEKKKHADESVAKGREYVAAYVEFIHFVESLHAAAVGPVTEPSPQGVHKH